MARFCELEARWGAAGAYHYLLEAEKSANIPSWKVADIDPEIRLANAYYVYDLALALHYTQAAA